MDARARLERNVGYGKALVETERTTNNNNEEDETVGADAIANLLHWVNATVGGDAAREVLDKAWNYFTDELKEAR